MVTHRLFAVGALVGLTLAPLAVLGQTAPRPAAAKAAPKAAAKAPAAKAAAGRFDARDPASLSALLIESGAKADVARKTAQEVYLNVVTPVGGFGVQFASCDASGKACRAVAFSTASQDRKANLEQINSFNQTSMTCRAFADKAGKVHVAYTTLLSAADTREEMKTHISVWQGCLASFGEFLTNPTGFLAAAP